MGGRRANLEGAKKGVGVVRAGQVELVGACEVEEQPWLHQKELAGRVDCEICFVVK